MVPSLHIEVREATAYSKFIMKSKFKTSNLVQNTWHMLALITLPHGSDHAYFQTYKKGSKAKQLGDAV